MLAIAWLHHTPSYQNHWGTKRGRTRYKLGHPSIPLSAEDSNYATRRLFALRRPRGVIRVRHLYPVTQADLCLPAERSQAGYIEELA